LPLLQRNLLLRKSMLSFFLCVYLRIEIRSQCSLLLNVRVAGTRRWRTYFS